MRLKDACVDPGQYGVNVSPEEYRSAGIRMLRTSDLADGEPSSDEHGVFLEGPVPSAQVLKENDLLLSRAGTIGRSYLVPASGAGSTFAGFLIRFRPRRGFNPRFLHYCLRSKPTQDRIHAEAVTSTIQNFNAERYANLAIPEVSEEEQRRIADFLDDRVARIDQVITARRRQLELVNERMSAAITNATTPTNNLGWRLMKFSRVMRINDGLVDPKQEPYSRMPLVAPNHIEKATGRLLSLESAEDQGAESGKGLVREGQIIYSKIRPALRKATIAPLDCLCSADAYALTPHTDQAVPDYLLAVILGDFFTQQVIEASERVAMPKVNRDTLREVSVWLPHLHQQEHAAKELAALRLQGDSIVSALSRSIDAFGLYKQSLITAAVAGELDVTTAGSGIPG